MQEHSRIGFIGAGNMATSIMTGMLRNGWPATNIIASDPFPASRERAAALGVSTSTDNLEVARNSEVLVLAVKPQQLSDVCQELASSCQQEKPLVISIAAGVSSSSLSNWLDAGVPIVRCMPNTPALVGLGASVLFASEGVDETQRSAAQNLLECTGLVAWVEDEKLMHAVTAVSGSGPAYFFLMLEAIRDVGSKMGLTEELANTLAIQTAAGAAAMAAGEIDLVELRRQVTSPGGTTERAIAAFEDGGLRQLVASAMNDCAERARELDALSAAD